LYWSELVIPLCLFIFGLIVLCALSITIIQSVKGRFVLGRFFLDRRLQRTQARLDELAQAAGTRSSVGDVRWAELFVINSRASSSDHQKKIHQNNLRVIEAMLELYAQNSLILEKISQLSDLVEARAHALRRKSDLARTCGNLYSRRKEKGKATPRWAASEYTRQIQEADGDLARNEKELRALVDTLGSSYRSEKNKIVIH
jgi:hypothetical protein